MKLTRYSDEAPVDYMVLADDGEWVPAAEALELQRRLAAADGLLKEAADSHDEDPDGNIGCELTRRIRTHLAGGVL